MEKPIPYYSADGKPRGFRSHDAAQRLIQAGLVSAAYGRKGHLRGIFARRADGSSAVEAGLRPGTRYSYREHLETGRIAWALKKLGKRNELRPMFLRIVADCLARPC